ncbi:MAG: type II secretion system protein [Planctomycetota bacterium]
MKRAFTLVEVLVVLAIIALLASILFPIFSQAKEAAWSVSCQNNLRQMGIAWEAVILDNGGVVPHTFSVSVNQWDGLLVKAAGLAINPNGPTIGCPIAPKAFGDLPPVLTSYAVNPLWRVDKPAGDNEGQPWGRLVSPSTYPLFADAAAIATLTPPALFKYFGVAYGTDWRIGFIHSDDTANVAYGDGHVEAEKRDVLQVATDTLGRPLWLFNRDPFGDLAMLP